MPTSQERCRHGILMERAAMEEHPADQRAIEVADLKHRLSPTTADPTKLVPCSECEGKGKRTYRGGANDSKPWWEYEADCAKCFGIGYRAEGRTA